MATKTAKPATKDATAKKAAPAPKKPAAKKAVPTVVTGEYSAPAETAATPDLSGLGWAISDRPFKRSRSSDDSPIAKAVAGLPFGVPVSSPSGQLQTITKHAKSLGETVTSVVDKEGPKGPDGTPLNRVWIKQPGNKATEEIPDLA